MTWASLEAEVKHAQSEMTRSADAGGRQRLSGMARSKKQTILVVDDDDVLGRALSVRLKLAGFQASSVDSAEQALGRLRTNQIDAVLSDLRMPGLSGIELLRRVRSDYPSVAFLLLTALDDAHFGVQAIKDGADDYLIKPVQVKDVLRNLRRALQRKSVEREALASQKRLEELVSERTSQLRSALRIAEESYENTLLALGAALDLRDGQTAEHSRRVREYSLAIAKRMCCSEAQLKTVSQGAVLHDIGKLGVPDAILLKPGKLTPEEWITMQGHVQIGYELVKRIPFLQDAAELVLSHHERYDGEGYPRRLRGEQIPLSARIFAVADTFDAMTTPRPYQATRPILQAIEEIAQQAGRQFDPKVVEAFLEVPKEILEEIHGTAKNGRFGTPSAGQTENEMKEYPGLALASMTR